MANYTGSKCEYCGRTFANTDDIVVCPQCGTPYHRECYEQAGKCINYELHENGGEWTSHKKEPDSSDDREEGIRCPRCGEHNPSTGLFCIKCGTSLNSASSGPRPFNEVPPPAGAGFGRADQRQGMPFGVPYQEQITKDTVLEGHTVGDYAKFVGSNMYYYLVQFVKFAKTATKISINFAALMFTEFYFFYRKMYAKGVIFFTVLILLSLPNLLLYVSMGQIPNIQLPEFLVGYEKQLELAANICGMAAMTIRVLTGVMANYWYFTKAKKTLDEISSADISEEDKDLAVAAAGGTSVRAAIVSVTAFMAAVLLIVMGIVAL